MRPPLRSLRANSSRPLFTDCLAHLSSLPPQVKPGSYDAKFVMGATATRDFLCGISVDALRQDYLWQTKALMNDTSAVLLTTTLQKEQSQPAAVPAAVEERRRCSAGSRWKGQWVALVNR